MVPPSSWIALLAGLLAGLAMMPSPLLGVHGVESALVLGVWLPPFVAAAGARRVVRARRAGVSPPASGLLAGAVGRGLVVLLVPVALLALNALRIRNCSPWQGLLFMLLGPLPGVVLAAVVGVAAGAAVRRAGLATALAVLVPLAGVAATVHRFYASPAIALYGHFFGWFPGAIYDEAIELPVELGTFRGVTALLTGGLALLVVALWDRGRMRLRLGRGKLPAAVSGAALLAAAGAAVAFGPELGHRTTAAHVEEELGARVQGERCIVVAPREMAHDELLRHVADCDFHVHRAEQVLGVRQRAPITAFLFRNADEKRRLMGAGRTHVAKPWRHEVYLNAEPWPHRVLGHEVAHVVAGSAASGPWQVAGRLAGWWPSPGLIEGVAVAVAWEPRDRLTPHQWARAMLELDRMPDLAPVVGLGFLVEQGALAYTVAGSFVAYLREHHGPAAVRRAYRAGDVERATGRPLPELEAEWRRYLRRVPLPPEAMALARKRFEGGSIFTTVCPRRVALLRRRVQEDRRAGDPHRLAETCSELLDIDAADTGARAHLVGALARLGRSEAAREELARLAGPLDAPAPVVAQARERLADAAWRQGEVAEAAALYRSLLREPQSDEAARVREVKALALEAGGEQAALLYELLVGDAGLGAPSPAVVHLARRLDGLRDDGLGEYLEARQLYFHRRFESAAELFEAALVQGLPTARLQAETERLLGTSLFASGRLDAADAVWAARTGPTRSPATRAEARRWRDRIAFTRRGAPSASTD